jgi:hypothetical protein
MKLSKQFQRYESEATQFLNNLKKSNPAIEQGQLKGRSLLWDKAPINLDTRAEISEITIPQQPYVYQNKG